MMMRPLVLPLAGLLLAGLAGCREKPALTAAAAESSERSSPLFKKARDAELSGNMKEAIRIYREILVNEPRAFSAHFQLATILQDSAEDYIGAIYHYNQYILFRPKSDKTTVAQERIRIAEQLLAPQILRRVGDSVEGLSQAHLLKENDRLNRVITSLEGDKSKLAEERDQAQKDLAGSRADYAHLKEILEKMKAPGAGAAPRADLGKIREGEPADNSPAPRANLGKLRASESRKISPSSAPRPIKADHAAAEQPRMLKGIDIAAMRREAESLAGASASKAPALDASIPADQKAPAAKASASPASKRGDSAAAADAAMRKPNHRAADGAEKQRTYVVQPGDTLFRVSEKFYGDSTHWKKIRNANRAVIDPDGRIRAGQVIAIPQ